MSDLTKEVAILYSDEKKKKKRTLGKSPVAFVRFQEAKTGGRAPQKKEAALTEAQSWRVTGCMTGHRDAQEKRGIRLEKY